MMSTMLAHWQIFCCSHSRDDRTDISLPRIIICMQLGPVDHCFGEFTVRSVEDDCRACPSQDFALTTNLTLPLALKFFILPPHPHPQTPTLHRPCTESKMSPQVQELNHTVS